MNNIEGLEQISDPRLRNALRSLGSGVHESAERKRCIERQVPYWKPGRRSQYTGHSQAVIAEATELAKRKSGEHDREPVREPSRTVPESVALNARLAEAARKTPDTGKYKQTSFL